MEEDENELKMPIRHIDLWEKITLNNPKADTLYFGEVYKVGDTNTDVELGVKYIEEVSKFGLVDINSSLLICYFTDAKSYSILLNHLTKC